MSDYRIHPFHLQQAEDRFLLITPRLIVELESLPLVLCLQWLSQAAAGGKTVVSGLEIEGRLGDAGVDVAAALTFLADKDVLQGLAPAASRVAQLTLVSRGELFAAEFEAQCRDVLPLPVRHLDVEEFLQPRSGPGADLCVLATEEYRAPAIQAFHQGLRTLPGAMGLVTYFRLRTFCVSTLYSPAYGTPCHFCDMGWEARGRGGPIGTRALAELMARFEGGQDLPLSQPLLRSTDRTIAAAYLLHLVEGLAALSPCRLWQDEVTLRRELQLDGLHVQEQPSAHWPGCDCQYQPAASP